MYRDGISLSFLHTEIVNLLAVVQAKTIPEGKSINLVCADVHQAHPPNEY